MNASKVLGVALGFVTISGMLGAAVSISRVYQSESPKISIEVFGEIRPVSVPELLAHANAAALERTFSFRTDLKRIQQAVYDSGWVKDVAIHQSTPSEIRIRCELRQPIALVQMENGKLKYIDPNGSVFGEVRSTVINELPMLLWVPSKADFAEMAKAVLMWKNHSISKFYTLSSLRWTEDLGLRAQLVMPSQLGRQRFWVSFGSGTEAITNEKLHKLSETLRAVQNQSIKALEVWADVPKKIVVKFTRPS